MDMPDIIFYSKQSFIYYTYIYVNMRIDIWVPADKLKIIKKRAHDENMSYSSFMTMAAMEYIKNNGGMESYRMATEHD